MRIIVTGGAGFIGSHLCNALLNNGHDVVCIDNLYTGSKKNIQSFLKNPKFQFVQQDITVPIDDSADQIYNLACPASPFHYQKDPVYTFKTSVFGTYNVLELAHSCKARILQASTSEVYGDPLEHPQKESYWGNVNPVGLRSCYDEGKRAAETLCMDFSRQFNVDVRIARIFNTYGPNMAPDDGRVVSNFIIQALENKPITIYGDGNQTRSFCYVSDMVDGLIKLMNSKITGPVNLGNPDEFTIKELAEKVISLTKSKSKLVYKPLPQDDPRQRKPDISLVESKLKWSPSVRLTEGLKKTIEYFKTI
ncbi:MAG: UDP-glucuronic acid decarboxylase family protein [Candidatus Woesearchaeota archaeon]